MTEVDDMQQFIAAEKKRIEQEKSELLLGNTPRRNSQQRNMGSLKVTQNESTRVPKPDQPEAVLQETSPRGIPFGTYGDIQDKLKRERAEEYKKFLAEKTYRATGAPSLQNRNEEKPTMKSILHKPQVPQEPTGRDLLRYEVSQVHRQQQSLPNYDAAAREGRRPRDKSYAELYEAYEELLARKRQDERRYRTPLDDPYSDSRRVHFDDNSRLAKLYADTWLDNGQRLRWDSDQNDARPMGDSRRRQERDDAFTQHSTQSASVKNEIPERISRSAPGQAVPILGEHDVSPEVKQQRQTRYREELQAQIKEREMQKKRNKHHTLVPDTPTENTPRNLPSNRSSVPQGYNSGLPQPRDNPVPPLGLNQAYYNPYLQNQAYHYGLPNSGLASALSPTGVSGSHPLSFREPVGGYQPSWANGPIQPQRSSGLGLSVGATGTLSDTRQPAGGGDKYGDFGQHIGVLPVHEVNTTQDRGRQQSYREELSRQMAEKEMKKKQAKQEEERYQMKLEREIAEYDPWGKAGGGAPLKDSSGKLVSDLRQMHQYNKEGTIISPRDHGPKPHLSPRSDVFTENERAATVSEVSTSNAVTAQPDSFMSHAQTGDPQKRAKMEYQDYLKQQIEEKKRKKKEEEDRLLEIAAREDKIIKEQQTKLQQEYEHELETSRKKEESARLKNEEMREAAEQKKKELEHERLQQERLQEEKLRKQLDERLKAAKTKGADRSSSPPVPTMQNQARSNSPPIPTLQKKQPPPSPPVPALQNQRSSSPPIPTLQSKTRTNTPVAQDKKTDRTFESRGNVRRQASQDGVVSRPSSNAGRTRTPSVTHNNYHSTTEQTGYRTSSAAADHDVLSQLTSLRRQLKNEEVKVQQQLTENKEKYVQLRENSGNRRYRKPPANVFDNVLRRNPGPTQKDQDMKSFKAMSEFNKLKYEDTSSLHGDFISQYPDPATTGSTLELQQQALMREQQRRLQAFRDRLLNGDKENVESFGNRTRPESKASQLESDSQFVSVEDPSKIVIEPREETSKPPVRLPSARERRRWKQVEQLVKNSKFIDSKPPTPGGFSINSVTSFNVDEIAQRNEDRLRRLEILKQARSETKGDPNEILKKFIQKHSRPDSKISENSLPADKQHIPNMPDH